MNNRMLLNYLPAPLREIREFKAIFEGKQGDYEELWRVVRHIPAERSVQTATEIGISHWETILGITPLSEDTLEDRRFRVQTRLLNDSKMNFAILRRKLDALCGTGAYEIDYRSDEYYLGVRVALRVKNVVASVFEMLDKEVPANFVLETDLLYITYGALEKMTYGEMSAYTYKQLREDADLMIKLGE